MVYGGGGPKTPAGFHAFFSAGVGAGIPLCAHEHNAAALIILLVLWAGIHLFILARGVFIDERAGEFHATGIGGLLFGLLFSAILVVFEP